jgi:predicted acylesterase/phospholipase RssA
MKGGVTSGLVYPGAVLELGTRYRFEKVGGTSAGAVAATFAAAAEYARQRAGRMELAGIDELVERFRQPGFVLSLFEPASAARPTFELSLAMIGARGSRARQSRLLAAAALRHRPLRSVVATALAAGVLALLAVALRNLSLVPSIVLVILGAIVVMLVAGWAVIVPIVGMLRQMWRTLPDNGFGVCPGVHESSGRVALTDWLHAEIQRLAELPPDQPLTFAMLEEHGIGLQMVTTDLGLARAVTMPFAEEQYLFAPAELRMLFPKAVVDHVLAAAGVPAEEANGTRAWFLPAKDLPVVIGARLSSSVPLLFSSLKLYSARSEAGRPLESFMTDGGVTSNFPIHFFDDWLPSHPTFGLDLMALADESASADDALVFLPRGTDQPRLSRAPRIQTVGGFMHQLQDAARNWRDELQAELPGFRDRVCQIKTRPGEGGFNLEADPETVGVLIERGHEAGREILRVFDWDLHRAGRYVTLMELLQENLSLLAERFTAYSEWLTTAGLATAADLAGRDAEWVRGAAQATTDLIEHSPTAPQFKAREEREPTPAMRIGPRV